MNAGFLSARAALSGIFSICSYTASAHESALASKTALLIVRVYFDPQIAQQFARPCSAITIEIDGPAAPGNRISTIPFRDKAAAGHPDATADGSPCTVSFSKVLAGAPLTLKATLRDFPWKPHTTHAPPTGQWSNPITLQAGQLAVRDIMIDRKR